jgi:class 3 adenylate cyclase
MPGQILLTEPVAKAASDAGIPVEEVGVRMMRGVDEPLALYRVTPSQ